MSAVAILAKNLGGALIPVLAKALGSRLAAERATEQVLAEINLKQLSNVAKLAEKEIEGNELQRNWRPKWMTMLRHLIKAYYVLTFLMISTLFVGIILGAAWATSDDMIDLIRIWIGVGVSLTTLATASFGIYAVGRTAEKIRGADDNGQNVGGSLLDVIKNLPGVRRITKQPDNASRQNTAPPAVYRTRDSNTQRVETKPEQADAAVDTTATAGDNDDWEPYKPQTGRRIPPEWDQ